MAIVNLNKWVPEEWGGALVKKFRQTSVLMRATEGGRREPMISNTKWVPKDTDMDVQFTAKGATFGLDDDAADNILLTAKKITAAAQIADEDVADTKSFADAITNKRNAAFDGAARLLDNAAFCTVGAATDEPTMDRPYTSVYQAAPAGNKFTFDISAGTGLRAGVKSAIQAAEDSEWATSDIVIVASPFWKNYLRDAVQDGSDGVTLWDPNNDTILSYPVYWGRSIRTSTVATKSPSTTPGLAGAAGNPLFIAIPRTMLIPGIRSTLEWRVTDPEHGPGLLSDSWYVTAKSRTAFAVGDGSAAGILEGIA